MDVGRRKGPAKLAPFIPANYWIHLAREMDKQGQDGKEQQVVDFYAASQARADTNYLGESGPDPGPA